MLLMPNSALYKPSGDALQTLLDAMSGTSNSGIYQYDLDVYTDTAGTDPADVDVDTVARWNDQLNSNDMQSTLSSTFYPAYNSDGLNFNQDWLGYSGWSVSSMTAHTVMMRIKGTSSDSECVLLLGDQTSGGYYAGVWQDGSSSTGLSQNAGSPTVEVDGGTSWGTTRDDLHTALTDGSWHTVEISGIDFSAGSNWPDGIFLFQYVGAAPQFYANDLDCTKVLICSDSDRSTYATQIDNWFSAGDPA